MLLLISVLFLISVFIFKKHEKIDKLLTNIKTNKKKSFYFDSGFWKILEISFFLFVYFGFS